MYNNLQQEAPISVKPARAVSILERNHVLVPILSPADQGATGRGGEGGLYPVSCMAVVV